MKSFRRWAHLLWLLVIGGSTAAQAASEVTFQLPSGVTVKLVERPIAEGHFKYTGCVNHSVYCIIDDQLAFGWVGTLPSAYLKSITVLYQSKSYAFDVRGMFDAWGHRPLQRGKTRYFGGGCSDSNTCQFRGLFSDGIGTFVAEWTIVGGVAQRTVLTSSPDIVAVFIDHIDPLTED